MMMKRVVVVGAALVGILMVSSEAIAQSVPSSVSWIVEDGVLIGAKHVEIDGSFYDVDFVDGNCSGLYAGCDSDADFAFYPTGTTEYLDRRDWALLAGPALVDQVIVDGPMGNFRSQPTSVRGISLCYSFAPCTIWFPVAAASVELAIDPGYFAGWQARWDNSGLAGNSVHFNHISISNTGGSNNFGNSTTFAVLSAASPPQFVDSDGDGVSNDDDAFPFDSSETLDTDGDLVGNNADTDDDGDDLTDTFEALLGTDPLLWDTDGDGLSDSEELIAGSDPLDENDPNPTPPSVPALETRGAMLLITLLACLGAIFVRRRFV